MATVTSQPVDADNTPDGAGNGISQARNALTNDENYCNLDTTSVGDAAEDTAIYSDWDDIASGLPSDATIDGIQVEFPEYFGNCTQVLLYISINGGTSYSSSKTVDLSGMTKNTDDDVTTPSGETDLWGLTWNPASLDWDDVWVKVDISDSGANKNFFFDYIQMHVHYSEAAEVVSKVLTINAPLTVNGKLVIK